MPSGGRWNGRLLGHYGLASFYSTEGSKMFQHGAGRFALTADADLARRIRAIQQESPFRTEANERACLLRWCYRAAVLRHPFWGPRAQAAEFGPVETGHPGRPRTSWITVPRTTPTRSRPPHGPLSGPSAEPDGVRRPAAVAPPGGGPRPSARPCGLPGEALPALGAKVAAYDQRAAPCPVGSDSPSSWRTVPRWMASMQGQPSDPRRLVGRPAPPKGSDWKQAGYQRGSCPNAEYLATHILNVPVDHRVTVEHLQRWLRDRDHGAPG